MSVDLSRDLLHRFGDRPFRVADAERAGVPRYELYRLSARGKLLRVGRGVFRRAGGAISSSTDLATVCARVPGGIICSNSALAYWDLTDELPAVVHVAVARGAHRPRIDFPATEVHVFAAATFDLERREETTETGERLSIYSPERAGCRCHAACSSCGAGYGSARAEPLSATFGRPASPAGRYRPRAGGQAALDRRVGGGDELTATDGDRVNRQLRRVARERHGRDTQALQVLYAIEGFLRRLSLSEYRCKPSPSTAGIRFSRSPRRSPSCPTGSAATTRCAGGPPSRWLHPIGGPISSPMSSRSSTRSSRTTRLRWRRGTRQPANGPDGTRAAILADECCPATCRRHPGSGPSARARTFRRVRCVGCRVGRRRRSSSLEMRHDRDRT